MDSAYVLIKTEAGRANEVRDQLSGQPGIGAIAVVAGPYDIVAEVRGADLTDIGKTVLNMIHGIEGVEHTTTCPVIG